MSDPDFILDTEELKYSLDLSSINLDFEKTQELKYSMDLSTTSLENAESELSSNNDNGSTDLSSDTDLGTGSELSYDDDDELTNLNEHLKPYNYEPSCQPRKILFQTVKMMKTLMLAMIVTRCIVGKEILTGVLVDIVEQRRQRLRVFVAEIQTNLLIITSKVMNVKPNLKVSKWHVFQSLYLILYC